MKFLHLSCKPAKSSLKGVDHVGGIYQANLCDAEANSMVRACDGNDLVFESYWPILIG